MQHFRGHRGIVRDLAFSFDGTQLASIGGKGKAISLWDLTRDNKKTFLSGSIAPVMSLCSSPTRPLLLAMNSYGGYSTWLLDKRTSEPSRSERSRFDATRYCHLVPGDRVVFLKWAFRRGYLCCEADIGSEEELPTFVNEREHFQYPSSITVEGFAFSASYFALGTRATGSKTSQVLLWPRPGSDSVLEFELRGSLHDLAFPMERTLAVAAGNDISLWDVESGERQSLLRGHKRMVTRLLTTSNGQHLVSISTDGIVRYWDVVSGREISALDWEIGPLHSLALTPDGTRAAVGSSTGEIVMWDVDL